MYLVHTGLKRVTADKIGPILHQHLREYFLKYTFKGTKQQYTISAQSCMPFHNFNNVHIMVLKIPEAEHQIYVDHCRSDKCMQPHLFQSCVGGVAALQSSIGIQLPLMIVLFIASQVMMKLLQIYVNTAIQKLIRHAVKNGSIDNKILANITTYLPNIMTVFVFVYCILEMSFSNNTITVHCKQSISKEKCD